MQKEKVIYKGESRVVRIDEKERKYILYDHKKVYLDKKGGVALGLPNPGFQTSRNTLTRTATATLASTGQMLSKTAQNVARNAKEYAKTNLMPDLAAANRVFTEEAPTNKNKIEELAKNP